MRGISKSRKIIDVILIILGILCINYFIVMKLINVSFAEFFLGIGVIFIVYSTVELRYNINLWIKVPKVLKVMIIILVIIGASVFIAVEGLIISGGNVKNTEKPDYLVVLGAGLRGEEISLSLKYRLDNAIEFNKLYSDVKIVVSGGQGPGEDITEAEAMRRYLIQKGIDEKLIIMENKSTSTYENFLFTKRIIDKNNDKNLSVTVITNKFHTFRAMLMSKKLGFTTYGYAAKNHEASEINFYIREFFSVVKAFLKGQLI